MAVSTDPIAPLECPTITAGDDAIFQVTIVDQNGAAIAGATTVTVNLISLGRTVEYLAAVAATQNGGDPTLWDFQWDGGFAAGQTGELLETPGDPTGSELQTQIVDDENKALIEVQVGAPGDPINQTFHFEATINKGVQP